MGGELSDENKIGELPAEVKVDEFNFEILDTGEVEEDVIVSGEVGGKYGAGMTMTELQQYLKDIKDKIDQNVNEKISNVSKETKDEIEQNMNEIEQNMSGMEQNIDERISKAKEEAKNEIHPVGSIYISTEIANAADVGKLLGGTWEVYATGRTLVGLDTSQTEFNAIGKTGGEKSHTLSIGEMPSHSHSKGTLQTGTAGSHSHSISLTTSTVTGQNTGSVTLTTNGSGAHSHTTGNSTYVNFLVGKAGVISRRAVGSGGSAKGYTWMTDSATDYTGLEALKSIQSVGNHTHTINAHSHTIPNHNHTVSGSTGSAGDHSHTISGDTGTAGLGYAHNNLQPYVVVYMYRRTK